jgi:hypothetical protein
MLTLTPEPVVSESTQRSTFGSPLNGAWVKVVVVAAAAVAIVVA